MDLRALRYFVATAEELNITRAAEKLHMSQPPLSHQLHLLEEELGTPLFLRGHRRLQLTPEGELLLRRARQLLELEEKTRGEIHQVQQSLSGRLFLGMVEGRAPYLAAGWIAGFRQAHPAVSYSLWNGSSDDVADRLDKGLSDLGIVASPYNTEQLRGLVVGQEPWAAILPRDHPLARDPSPQIPLASLVGVPLIVPSLRSRMEAIRRWFAQIGKEPLFLCDTSNYLDAVALTEQGGRGEHLPPNLPHPQPAGGIQGDRRPAPPGGIRAGLEPPAPARPPGGGVHPLCAEPGPGTHPATPGSPAGNIKKTAPLVKARGTIFSLSFNPGEPLRPPPSGGWSPRRPGLFPGWPADSGFSGCGCPGNADPG